jgi:hypothetical protein
LGKGKKGGVTLYSYSKPGLMGLLIWITYRAGIDIVNSRNGKLSIRPNTRPRNAGSMLFFPTGIAAYQAYLVMEK